MIQIKPVIFFLWFLGIFAMVLISLITVDWVHEEIETDTVKIITCVGLWKYCINGKCNNFNGQGKITAFYSFKLLFVFHKLKKTG